ncbi:unnamed protein product [Prorocentrum cordatum]|uniref:EF-hand domain-containing protein n=1 Tax=Prorocentrum cordatum TaxID=2364126 RepID=A0ABN9W3C2_9DINO|nr:unnamed protein product [Polarella glacialis]
MDQLCHSLLYGSPGPTDEDIAKFANERNDMGWTPLLLAAQNGYHTICKGLLLAAADPNTATHGTRLTPLMLAASNGHRETVSLLLDPERSRPYAQRADPWTASSDGRSALDFVRARVEAQRRLADDQANRFDGLDVYGVRTPQMADKVEQYNDVERAVLRALGRDPTPAAAPQLLPPDSGPLLRAAAPSPAPNAAAAMAVRGAAAVAQSFRELDRSGDAVVTRLEFVSSGMGSADEFDKIDCNHDGTITAMEFHRYQQAKAWDDVDRNKDGLISRQEFLKYGLGRIDDFDALDLNRDGVISKKEWDKARLLDIWYAADADRDGKITLSEFVRFGLGTAREFHWADADHDGFVTRAELDAARQKLAQAPAVQPPTAAAPAPPRAPAASGASAPAAAALAAPVASAASAAPGAAAAAAAAATGAAPPRLAHRARQCPRRRPPPPRRPPRPRPRRPRTTSWPSSPWTTTATDQARGPGSLQWDPGFAISTPPGGFPLGLGLRGASRMDRSRRMPQEGGV